MSSAEARPPSSEHETLTLATFLPYRLNVVASAVSDGLSRIYGERFGIAIPEWRVLATLGEFGSMTAKAIGAHAHMSKVKVSRAAATLEVRGLISRSPNADDLREAFLVLTPAGRVVYDEVVPLALAYVARLGADLDRDETALLHRLLDKLLASAERMRGSAG